MVSEAAKRRNEMSVNLERSEQIAVNLPGVDRRLLMTAVALLLVGCTNAEGPPVSATVIIEASASAEEPLILTVSTSFDVVTSGEIVYTNLDSITITGNYNEQFALNSEARFTAKLLNEHSTEEPVRLSVLIDGGTEYDEIVVLGQGGFLQYVYRFQALVGF